MNVSTLKKSMTRKLLALALPLLLLFGVLAATPDAQARDRDDHRRGRNHHEYRRGGEGRRYDRGRNYRQRRHHGYWRRYHGRRYWYEGGRYYDGPGGLIIRLGF